MVKVVAPARADNQGVLMNARKHDGTFAGLLHPSGLKRFSLVVALYTHFFSAVRTDAFGFCTLSGPTTIFSRHLL